MRRTTDRAPRRWRSISLRAAMVLIVGLALWLGRQARLAREQREAVAVLKGLLGYVRYDWEYAGGKAKPNAEPWAPGWLRQAIGEEYFQEVVEVDLIYVSDRQGLPKVTPRETEALMTALAAFPNVRYLELPGELATDRTMDTVGGLTRLETLRMWQPRVTAAGLAKLRGLRNLKVLKLSDAWLGEHHAGLGDDALEHLAPLVRLESLDLGGNPITDAGLVHLQGLTSLEFLSLRGTKVSDAGLERLLGLTNLKEIWVSRSGISDEAVLRFQAGMPNLQVVR